MADCSLSTYLPVASSLLGAITGGGIGFLTARFAINRNARAAAAAKLRAAFTPELIAMRFDRGKEKFDADRILRDAFLRHATAVEEFRTFVKPRNKLAYEQAWRQYYESAVASASSII